MPQPVARGPIDHSKSTNEQKTKSVRSFITDDGQIRKLFLKISQKNVLERNGMMNGEKIT